jgi:hypothetical protein
MQHLSEVAQLAVRAAVNRQVVGSNPTLGVECATVAKWIKQWSTKPLIAGSSPASCVVTAEVAQLVERRFEEPRVIGSNPIFGMGMMECTLIIE